MQTGCIHCGKQHLLKDDVIAKHAKVRFRCTNCGLTTIVEVKRRVDETVAISPMPSFARADLSKIRTGLPAGDEGLYLPENVRIVLRVTSGPASGSAFTLSKPRTVIGRKGADFSLNDPETSRNHCELEVRGAMIKLKDLDSTNGTFFGEERIRAAVLQDQAEFRIGSSTIQMSLEPK